MSSPQSVSVSHLSTVNAAQIHKLLLSHCSRSLPSEQVSVVSQSELVASCGANQSLRVVTVGDSADPNCAGLLYPTYSTWVGARCRLFLFHRETASDQELNSLITSAVQLALDDPEVQQIEVSHPVLDTRVCELLSAAGGAGFADISVTLALHFARLDESGLKRLAERPAASDCFIRVRQGAESDCPDVMAMIRDLAEFENIPDMVTITAQQLKLDIFGHRQLAKLLIAETAEATPQAVGFALYFNEFWPRGKGVCLEVVFVKPQFRGRGVCSALFSAVASDAVANGCKFMSLCFVAWNSAAFDIYKRYGFVDITESETQEHCYWLERRQFVEYLRFFITK